MRFSNYRVWPSTFAALLKLLVLFLNTFFTVIITIYITVASKWAFIMYYTIIIISNY